MQLFDDTLDLTIFFICLDQFFVVVARLLTQSAALRSSTTEHDITESSMRRVRDVSSSPSDSCSLPVPDPCRKQAGTIYLSPLTPSHSLTCALGRAKTES
jgi:hypothetical protein